MCFERWSLGTTVWRNPAEVNAAISIWGWPENILTVWTGSFCFSLPCTDKKLDLQLSVLFQCMPLVSLSPSINQLFCYRLSSFWLRKLKHKRVFRSRCLHVPAPLSMWNSCTWCQVGFPEIKCVFCVHTCVTLNWFCAWHLWDLRISLEMTDCWREFV